MLTCRTCGEQILPPRRKYCSRKCFLAVERAERRARREANRCRICGASLAHRLPTTRYCSRQCQRRVEVRSDPRPQKPIGDNRVEWRAWAAVLARDPCVYCGGESSTVDHIVPLSRGGEERWLNLTSACIPCNNAKKSHSLLAFLGLLAIRSEWPGWLSRVGLNLSREAA